MSVTCRQCNARSTVTFPTERRHCPLAGTKLYCLETEARVLTTCPGLHSTAGSKDSKYTEKNAKHNGNDKSINQIK